MTRLRIFGILLALLGAIALPVVLQGYREESRARLANEQKDYSLAGSHFESAARILVWKPELWERAATGYAFARDWTRAVPLFEASRRRGVLSADGWDLLGTGYWTQGQYENASEAWSEGLQRYPDATKFHARLALAYRGLKNYAAERQALESWLPAGRASAAEHFRLGQLLMASDSAGARAELRQAAAMDASFGPAADTLVASLDVAALQTGRADQLILVGRGLGLVGDWALAQDAFEQAVNQERVGAEAWAWLAEARQHNGQDGGQELEQALSLDPADPLIHALRGLYWKRRGDFARELAESRLAATLDPKNPERQAALGEAYTATGDLVSALASYQSATEMSPQDPAYWRQLALFCADNGVQVLEIGLPAARKAVELAPSDALAQDALGWSYSQAGYLFNAQQALVQATTLAPDFAVAHLHLAETYLRAGNRQAALQELDRVRQLDADGPAGGAAAQLIKQYFP